MATLVDAYRRERLSLLQYVRQATPFAGPSDRPLRDRIQQLADAEASELDALAEHLDRSRVPVSHVGAFPSEFTNYNFMAVRKLLPRLRQDEERGAVALDRDADRLPPGDARERLRKLAEGKRMHLMELEKLAT
jgi:hypothetical protein